MGSDFVFRVGSGTNIIGRPPRFYHSSRLIDSGSRFASVYAVRKEDAKAVEEAGSSSNFRGIVWSQRLWVDFDQEKPAQRARDFLIKERYDHVVYHTGNRGLHIGILRDNPPSHLLPYQDKKWVSENLPGADLSLYWHLHLIRLPGALHESTGKPKRLIYTQAGRSLTLPKFISESQKADLLPGQIPTLRRPPLFTVWSVLSNLTGEGLNGRHEQLVQLAIALKRDAKVTYEEALWVVGEVNNGFSDPKSEEELIRITKWAYEEVI